MKLRTKILLTIMVITSVVIITDSILINRQQKPLFVLHANTYKDGGTRTYYGLGYKAIHWNKLSARKSGSAELKGIYQGWEISYFPFFKSLGNGPSKKIPFVLDPLCQPSQTSIHYFSNQLIAEAKQRLPGYDKKGLNGGIDGFNLMRIFHFEPKDFEGVVAQGGDYYEQDGKLFYSGHAASDSPILTKEGMKTLLINSGKRLNMHCHSINSIDKMISHLRKGIL
jgi:hypothetical protein